ncbi:MAG: Pr6Pr family membrane protein [Clostridia bacterium]|nr:Pr6Pr family membrane protein [Clostridia bacterium]
MEKRKIPDAVLNLLGAAITLCAVLEYFTGKPDALGSIGTGCFRYFTTDSNVLAAIACAAVFICRLKGGKLPKPVLLLKFTGTVAVTVTLLTVVFFLGPTSYLKSGWPGYMRMFEGNTLVLHLIMPLLCLISLLTCERERISFRESLWALLPTAVYAVVYFIAVWILKAWPDFYGFTFGGKAYMVPVSGAAMLGLTLGLACLLRRLMSRKEKA